MIDPTLRGDNSPPGVALSPDSGQKHIQVHGVKASSSSLTAMTGPMAPPFPRMRLR